MNKLKQRLAGGDLRSIGKVDSLLNEINSQSEFDELFENLFDADRLVVMRSADAIEKLTLQYPDFLQDHKKELFQLLKQVTHIELKWHLAQLITRVKLSKEELGLVWSELTNWALDKKESRIVRVLSLQGLFDLLTHNPALKTDFEQTIARLENEQNPSIAARIRILKKKL